VFRGWGWQGGQKPEGASGSEKKSTTKTTTSSAKSKSSSSKSSSKSSSSKSKTIEELSTTSLFGGTGASIFGKVDTVGDTGVGYELLIENDKVYLPTITGSLELEYHRHGQPTSLKFNVLKDENIDFQEGSPVRLRVDGEDIFRGYVFEKSRKERNIIAVKAYDSLRYLKNKDTILYKSKRYSELVKMIAEDYKLKVGDIADTGYIIERQLEEGTLFDILENAADITYTATGNRFILLDDFGKICLRAMQTMTLDTELNKDNISGFDYTSTIDKEVYDYVVMSEDDKSEGVRRIYTASDDNVSRWGRLQLYTKPKEEMNTARLRELAASELAKYSRKRRYLKLYDVKGDIAVRGGSVLKVSLDLGDIVIDEYMMCERVKHTFAGKSHLMDIDLYGREGEFDV
jgi:hypothetical protein